MQREPYTKLASGSPPALAEPVLPETGNVPCSQCQKVFRQDQLVTIGGVPVCSGCKPLALQCLQEGASLSADSEKLRRDHLNHESDVKSIGLLYFLSAGIMAVGTVTLAVGSIVSSERKMLLFLAPFVLILLFLTATGIGLRKLLPWARVCSIIISTIGLLGFPLGTVINAYILYLLVCKKGSMVFSEHYRKAVADTPHIKSRISVLVWVAAGLLVLASLALLIRPVQRLLNQLPVL